MQAKLRRRIFVCRTEEQIIEYHLSYPYAEIHLLDFIEDPINLSGKLILQSN